MSLDTKTTKEISDNIIAQLEATLNQTIPLLPKSFMRVLAKTLAGVFIILYKYAGFIFLQIFVQTASIRLTEINGKFLSPLIQWGRLIGVGDPTAATSAELLIDVTVENQTGVLAAGSQLIGATNGVVYLTLTAITLDAPIKQVTVVASSDQSGGNGSGVIGNLDAGAVLSFANPLPNVARDAVVDSQTVTGADAEATEAYRQRILDRFQKRPQGGAYADYEQWAEEAAGVLRAYPYTSACPGQVDVYIESSTEVDGIPTTPQLQAALDSIELDENGLATRRPANALANTLPIVRTAFDVIVSGLTVDNQAQVETDITTALTEYFVGREPFIPGLSILPRLDRITESAVGGIVDDIVSAAGGIFLNARVFLVGVNTPIYQLGEGEKSKLLTATYP